MVLFSLVTAAALPAGAQDSVTADALFQRGVTDMTEGRLDAACPAIGESQRLDPRPGTLFTLAECEARRGRTATAVTHYAEYLAIVERLPAEQRQNHADRARVADAKRRELTPRVPTLMLVLPASAPPGTEVQRDGVVLRAPSLGVAIPIDPGEHVVSTRAPSRAPREQRFSIAAGEKRTLTLELDAPVAPSAAVAAPSTAAPRGRAIPTSAYVAGGVGAAGLVVGAIAGLLAVSKKSAVDAHCADVACDAEGKDAADALKRDARVSNVAFGIGALGVAAGAVLFFTAPSAPADAGRTVRTRLTLSGARDASVGLEASW